MPKLEEEDPSSGQDPTAESVVVALRQRLMRAEKAQRARLELGATGSEMPGADSLVSNPTPSLPHMGNQSSNSSSIQVPDEWSADLSRVSHSNSTKAAPLMRDARQRKQRPSTSEGGHTLRGVFPRRRPRAPSRRF